VPGGLWCGAGVTRGTVLVVTWFLTIGMVGDAALVFVLYVLMRW